jgi:integrase
MGFAVAGKSDKGAMRLLVRQGNIWWFKRAIPLACRPSFGGTGSYLENLGTSDIRIAKERRDMLEAETSERFGNIRAGRGPDNTSPANRGHLWRSTLNDLQGTPEADPEKLDDARHALAAERETLRGAPKRAFDDALGGRVAVDHYLEAYLVAVASLAPATLTGRAGHIRTFAAWADGEGVKLTGVTRKVAGSYVTAFIDAKHPKTAEAHLLSLRQYWSYLHARGHVAGDDRGGPWAGQRIRNNAKRAERGDRDTERPFTEAEVQALLYSPYPKGMQGSHRAQLQDALRVSLLSGMRLEEVLTLWVEDVHSGVFDIQQGKTDAAARKVPVHPGLTEVIERRTAGKGPKDWLFHELRIERDPGDVFGKRFKRYRESLGVSDNREGKRRSLVNFHSARRWFATSARYAGHPVETVGNIMGHRPDKKDLTFGVYTPGASDAQKRACIEAVSLPAHPAQSLPA